MAFWATAREPVSRVSFKRVCTYFCVRTLVGPLTNSLVLNALRDTLAGKRRRIYSFSPPRQRATEPVWSLESQSYRPHRPTATAPHPPPQEWRLHTQRPLRPRRSPLHAHKHQPGSAARDSSAPHRRPNECSSRELSSLRK